ncbi:MAG: acyltransferase [Brumimicrobium sp.]|nr:acyltransferase [Brumimicrobium sp.]
MNPNNPTRLHKMIFRLIPNFLLFRYYGKLKIFQFIKETRNTQTPITIKNWYNQKVLGKNYGPYWPCHETSTISGWQNIYCGIETCPGYSPGNYISAYYGKIFIGDYTQIGPNVGMIAANHDVYDNAKHIESKIKIGEYCWIGMGAVILPEVVLGDFTIVGAGAIVTKSFEEGYCVIGGNPARKIKDLDKEKCIRSKSNHEYNGYIPSSEFHEFRKKHLNV